MNLGIFAPELVWDTRGISFETGFGFPELKYLRFFGRILDENDLTVFKYCCANSLKLETLSLQARLESEEHYQSISETIGRVGNENNLYEKLQF